MSQEKFTPKFELGTKVYVVDTNCKEIYSGIVELAILEKIPYTDEYGNQYFENSNSYAKPSFRERFHVNCRIDGGKDMIMVRYEEGVFSTPEDAMSYLSKVILKKLKQKRNETTH